MRIAIASFAIACATTACDRATEEGVQTTDYLPSEPDYADKTQWYVSDRNADADIFYIISTETGDYALADGTPVHYADTYADSLRQPMLSEMQGVDELLSGKLNFFSPFYRQCSLQTFTSESLTRARLSIASADVKAAFRHYLANDNDGRPFVLAGFSQGAMIMLDLLKDMEDDVFGRMVAAYAIGISIDEGEIEQNSHIVPAQGETDTGVTICYNSVRDTSCSIFGRSSFAINPVNWRTDTTAATLITEPSPFVPLSEQSVDTLTVRLDTESNLLIVSGYSAKDYVLPLIGKEGCYHSREIWLYRNYLRKNVMLRTETALRK